MILDQHGRAIARESHTSLHAGWIRAKGLTDLSAADVRGLEHLDRDRIRAASRSAYMTNGVLSGAVDVLHKLAFGTGLTYGVMDDPRAQAVLEEFWSANDWDTRMDRWLTEFLIDGENLTRFPKSAPMEQPARVGFVNVADSLTLVTEDGLPDHVTSIKIAGKATQQEVTLAEGEFVWTAHESLWNDPRGWPPIMRAIPPALAYVDFMDTRIRVHKALARINAVYKASATGPDPHAELQAKADLYGSIPNDGHVLTLHKDLQSGQSEEFDFLTGSTNAGDSQHDARAIIRMLGLALNLPDHFLGIGDTGNRATAEAMSEPVIKSIGVWQNTVRGYMNRVLRLEAKRRNGPERLYTVKRVSVKPDGLTRVTKRKRVTADELEFPIVFPTLRAEDLAALVTKVGVALDRKLVSLQTASGELGYDYALELEHMANEAGIAPTPRQQPPAQPTAQPPDNDEPSEEP